MVARYTEIQWGNPSHGMANSMVEKRGTLKVEVKAHPQFQTTQGQKLVNQD